MAEEVAREPSESESRWRSRGGRETVTTGKVCIVCNTSCLFNTDTQVGHWKKSERDRWHCQERRSSLESSIRRKIRKKSSNSWKRSGKLSWSIRSVPEVGGSHSGKLSTNGTGVATTVDIQPGRLSDREFPLPVSGIKTQRTIRHSRRPSICF
jgi:hypothetical protein